MAVFWKNKEAKHSRGCLFGFQNKTSDGLLMLLRLLLGTCKANNGRRGGDVIAVAIIVVAASMLGLRYRQAD